MVKFKRTVKVKDIQEQAYVKERETVENDVAELGKVEQGFGQIMMDDYPKLQEPPSPIRFDPIRSGLTRDAEMLATINSLKEQVVRLTKERQDARDLNAVFVSENFDLKEENNRLKAWMRDSR